MVRVVVHHRHTRRFAHALEPARDSGELAQRAQCRVHVRAQLVHHRERRGGVAHVVHPGHPQRQRDGPAAGQRHHRARSGRGEFGVADAHLRIATHAHAPDVLPEPRGDPLRTGIVPARDHATRATRELRERVFQRGDRAVALEVVGLHVVDDRHRRRQREERAVEFVRLDHEQVAPAKPRVPAPASDTAAGESRRIPPGGRQRLRDHHRRGRLPVRSGDRH